MYINVFIPLTSYTVDHSKMNRFLAQTWFENNESRFTNSTKGIEAFNEYLG